MFKFLFAIIIFAIGMLLVLQGSIKVDPQNITNIPSLPFISQTPTPIPLVTPPNNKVLENNYHVFQTYNNCGPAAFSMALSYYGIQKSQLELGQELRPWQNPQGDNDDKSTTLEELAEKSIEYGFIPFHRPNGSIQLIKQFITYDIPVVTRTWLKPEDDIGHYRVIKGFNENSFIQDDSLQGKNLQYTYDEFNIIWKKFNYEYLVLVPKDKEQIARAILGENTNKLTAWRNAVKLSEKELQNDPNDISARFNLSVALTNVGDHKRAVGEFEKAENQLPFRTLWYQIEPIESYFELGNYSRVFEITNKILDNHNRAFSELYLIRGKIYKQQGNLEAARSEFEKAVLYNKNLKAAQEALSSI